MTDTIQRNVLLKAVKIIKQWHDMPAKNPDPMMFKIYYNQAPEMKLIREALGPYDEIKDEVIEATSNPIDGKQ